METTQPLIIFGAGASYDYIRSVDRTKDEGFQPPLVDDLFHKRFEEFVPSEIEILSAGISAKIRGGKGLEEYLTELKLSEDVDRKKELIAIQFYLQKLFQKISSNYGGQIKNNYNALLNEFPSTLKNAIFVTFNYDLLFEEVLSRKHKEFISGSRNLDTYINRPLKLIKVHGSCDWKYPYNDTYDEVKEESNDSIYEFFMENPKAMDELSANKNREIFVSTHDKIRDNDRSTTVYGYPALAIPVEDKEPHFICPENHIKVLGESFDLVNKILIVGWRARDEAFVSFLKENIKMPTDVFIVSKLDENGEGGSKEVIENLKHIDKLRFETFDGGFSDFVASSEFESFFKQWS